MYKSLLCLVQKDLGLSVLKELSLVNPIAHTYKEES